MNYKALFKKLFKTAADFLDYLRWRQWHIDEAKRERNIKKQIAKDKELMLRMSDDPDDDDYDPMTMDVWNKMQ